MIWVEGRRPNLSSISTETGHKESMFVCPWNSPTSKFSPTQTNGQTTGTQSKVITPLQFARFQPLESICPLSVTRAGERTEGCARGAARRPAGGLPARQTRHCHPHSGLSFPFPSPFPSSVSSHRGRGVSRLRRGGGKVEVPTPPPPQHLPFCPLSRSPFLPRGGVGSQPGHHVVSRGPLNLFSSWLALDEGTDEKC